MKIIFANVDIACSDSKLPKPRSEKGSGAERLCSTNDLFGGLPHFAIKEKKSDNRWSIFYLMVAPNGVAELSSPIVKDQTFKQFVERIYFSDGSDFDSEPEISLDIVDNFDPMIAR